MTKSVAPPRVVNIEDLRRAARRRLPRVVFDYIDGGADGENTLRENCRAFDSLTFRPLCAVETPPSDLRTTVLGTPLSMPIMLGPVGSCRMFYPRGEEAAARAAGEAGTLYALSTLSGCRLEDVRSATKGPAWYQLYLVGGRDVATATIGRARAAGYSALVVTIDTPVAGLRERDIRNGTKELLTRRLGPMLPYVGQFLARPRWLAAFLRDGGLMTFPNVMLADGPMLYADVGTALEQSVVTWRDLRWIRDAWNGPIVVKGFTPAKTRGVRLTRVPARSSSRITAAVSSTRCVQRYACCRKSSPRSADRWKCCSTAESGAAATSPRRFASAPARC